MNQCDSNCNRVAQIDRVVYCCNVPIAVRIWLCMRKEPLGAEKALHANKEDLIESVDLFMTEWVCTGPG